MYEDDFEDGETYYFDPGSPGPTLGKIRRRESSHKGHGAKVFTVEHTVSDNLCYYTPSP